MRHEIGMLRFDTEVCKGSDTCKWGISQKVASVPFAMNRHQMPNQILSLPIVLIIITPASILIAIHPIWF